MSDREQNKRINELRRQLSIAAEKIKTLELDMEPEGRISEGFTALENHMDENFAQINSRLDRMERQSNSRFDKMQHQFNQLQAKLEVVLEAITRVNDLPEDETE